MNPPNRCGSICPLIVTVARLVLLELRRTRLHARSIIKANAGCRNTIDLLSPEVHGESVNVERREDGECFLVTVATACLFFGLYTVFRPVLYQARALRSLGQSGYLVEQNVLLTVSGLDVSEMSVTSPRVAASHDQKSTGGIIVGLFLPTVARRIMTRRVCTLLETMASQQGSISRRWGEPWYWISTGSHSGMVTPCSRGKRTLQLSTGLRSHYSLHYADQPYSPSEGFSEYVPICYSKIVSQALPAPSVFSAFNRIP